MSLASRISRDWRSRRIGMSISIHLLERLRTLRKKLEARFRIRIGDEEVIEYLCEKALEKMEDAERREGPG